MTLLPALMALFALAFGVAGVRALLREMPDIDPESAPTPSGSTSEVRGMGRDLFGIADRLRRAGLDQTLAPRTVLIVKATLAAGAMLFGSLFTTVLPDRLAPAILIAVAAGGFILPDFMLERAARRRHQRMVNALPDALDLLAVSVQTGRGLGGCLLDLAGTGRGPLVEEMSRTGDDIAWGTGQAAALEDLRRRIGGPEIASFVSTLERSRRLGSPLADQLRRQSATLRQEQRRSIEEEAARAAPKIQLVIALILVPSVLLLIVAALVANANSLINVGY